MNPSNLFVYGILKRGFQLDLEERGAKFLGEAQLPGAILYHIGRGGVGLRLVEDPNRVALGEVFEIPGQDNPETSPDWSRIWNWLDQIEANGLAYTRKVVTSQVMMHYGYEPIETWVYEHTYPSMKYDKPIESGRYEYVKGY